MSEGKENTNLIVGFLLGGGIATIATLLLTPRKGEENRKILKKTAQALPEMAGDLSSSLKTNTHRLSLSTQQQWHYTLQRLESAIASGIEASKNYNGSSELKLKDIDEKKETP